MESGRGRAANVGVRVGAASVGGYLTTTLGPEGGAAAAESLAQSGEALVGWLEERSRGRVARTLRTVSEKVVERTARGETVRADLADAENGDAAALFEAVVEAAAKSAEDRKCEVIANTYVTISFDPLTSIDNALLYVRRIRDSSWRQLVALQFLVAGDRGDERKAIAARCAQGAGDAGPALAAELTELGETLGLTGVLHHGYVNKPSSVPGGGEFRSESLTMWTATTLGQMLARIGDLASVVQNDDLDELARDLSAPVDWGY